LNTKNKENPKSGENKTHKAMVESGHVVILPKEIGIWSVMYPNYLFLTPRKGGATKDLTVKRRR
jgi:hypothetical protein